MGFFDKKSYATTNATSTNLGISDADNVSAIQGSGNVIAITDGGAIRGGLNLASQGFGLADSVTSQGLDLADRTSKRATDLTLDLVQMQLQSGRDSVAAIAGATESAANLGYQFAMDAGRSDVATMQDTTKKVLILVGIVAAAYVLHGWKK